MNIIGNIDFYDFSFNGHLLSEYGGMVGGTERLSTYPLLPQRSYTTERAIGQNGQTIFDSYLEPRQFEVPVFFEDIDYAGIRNIAGWLNTVDAVPFYFVDDTLKINCVLDSNGTALETISGPNGQTSLKFIAHDPFYYEITPTSYEYDISNSDKTELIELTNLGNVECYPQITIRGTGEISVSVLDNTGFELTKCTISNVTTNLIIDSIHHTCVTNTGGNLYSTFSGSFPIIPTGDYKIQIDGNVSKVIIIPNHRWV